MINSYNIQLVNYKKWLMALQGFVDQPCPYWVSNSQSQYMSWPWTTHSVSVTPDSRHPNPLNHHDQHKMYIHLSIYLILGKNRSLSKHAFNLLVRKYGQFVLPLLQCWHSCNLWRFGLTHRMLNWCWKLIWKFINRYYEL